MVHELEKHQPIVQLKKPVQQNGYARQAGYIETEPNIRLSFGYSAPKFLWASSPYHYTVWL